MSAEHRQRIALDFDGVIHSYVSGWHGVTIIQDPPVKGAIEWLTTAVEHFEVMIHSSRLAFDESEPYHEIAPVAVRIEAMKRWLAAHGCPEHVINALRWHTGPGKPHAHAYLDDRGHNFNGVFPDLEELAAWRPWGGKRRHVFRDVERERRELLMRAEVLMRNAEEHLPAEQWQLYNELRELCNDIATHLIPRSER